MTTLPPYTPPPPVKEGRGPLFWIAAGCGGCLTLLVVFVIAVYAVVVMAMRNTTPVKDSLALANRDPRVEAVFGRPLEPGLFFTGKINVDNDEGGADVSFSVSGPKASGRMRVVAHKAPGGNWEYEQIRVTPKGGTAIDVKP